jgi:segregation and condensation protein A
MDEAGPPTPHEGGSIRGLADWEDPPRSRPGAGSAPVLSTDGFEAPLDWLLEMVTAQKIDLGRLSILSLVEAFNNALEAALDRRSGASPLPLGQWGSWLVMAATLAWLRSRLMLPADAPEARAAVTEAEALRQLLLRRQQIGAAADWLDRQPRLGRDVFTRARSDMASPGRAGDITALLRACLAALKLDLPVDAYRPRVVPLWRLSDALSRFGELLPTLPLGSPITAYLPSIPADSPDRRQQCRVAVASTLLASLELARNGALTLEQPGASMPVEVYWRSQPAA